MDTIIYLLLEKERIAGELKDSSPVFIIQEQREICRLIYVKISANWKILSSQKEKNLPNKKKESTLLQDDFQKDYSLREKEENINFGKNFFHKCYQTILKISKSLYNKSLYNKEVEKDREEVTTLWAEELLEYLKPFLWNTPIAYCICDASVEKWIKQQQLSEWWKQHWSLPVFEEYHRREFLECLLEQAYSCQNCPSHYLILGYDSMLLSVLWQQAKKIKSLRLLLKQMPEELQEELEEGLEELNEEFGLIASVQFQPKISNVQSIFPVLIIDFTGEEKLFVSEVAQGSIWLDMDSLEEKRRRIEGRNTGILYFSMKKHWKRIDTLFKNRYNTKVN